MTSAVYAVMVVYKSTVEKLASVSAAAVIASRKKSVEGMEWVRMICRMNEAEKGAIIRILHSGSASAQFIPAGKKV